MTAEADYRAALRLEGRVAMQQHPTLDPEWVETEQQTVLRVQASPDGFDVQVAASAGGIQLDAGTYHTHFDDEPQPAARNAVTLMMGLLSPAMRLRERRVNGKLRSASIEVATDSGWAVRETFGLLFWNVFGRRTEHVYQNHHLPLPRDEM